MEDTSHYLERLQEAETTLWVKEGLDRLEEHVRATGGDEELLDLIEYLKDDNDYWLDPELVADAQNSHLTLAS